MKRSRPLLPVFGALVVALAMAVVAYLVSSTPDTAPINPPDREGTHEQTPAGPADRNALPGNQ